MRKSKKINMLNGATAFLGALVLFATAGFQRVADAQSVERPEFHLEALLISLEAYDDAALKYAKEDLKVLNQTLQLRYGCKTECVFDFANVEMNATEIGDDAPKKNIERKIRRWFQTLPKDATAILFLAGHGVRDDDGVFYFPMLNFKTVERSKRFSSAAIPLSWIRSEFEKAQCKNRLVAIDACFSGGSKNIDAPDGETLARAFQGDADSKITTLASSSESEESWLWDETKSSLFTYWLNDALNGAAQDEDGDNSLSLPELFAHVKRKVVDVSTKHRGMKRQTPILLNEEANADFAFPAPRMQTLPRAVQDANKVFADAPQSLGLSFAEKPKILVVPEFKTGGRGSTIDSTNYGTLPSFVSREFAAALETLEIDGETPFVVLTEERASEILKDNGLSPSDIGSGKERDALIKAGVDAVLDGRVTALSPIAMKLTARVIFLKNDYDADQKNFTATVRLTENELALRGDAFSFKATNDETKDETNDETNEETCVATEIGVMPQDEIERLDEIAVQVADQRNPMDDDSLPYKVEIFARRADQARAKFVKRVGKTKNGVYYVPLDQGEEYRLNFVNSSEDGPYCYVRVLIDGVSATLREASEDARKKSAARLLVPEAKDPNASDDQAASPTYLPDFSLETAVPLKVDAQKSHALDGYLFIPRDSGKAQTTERRFLVVDAQDSLAARNEYKEQIGLITVEFSVPEQPSSASDSVPEQASPASDQKRRGSGTGFGGTTKVKIKRVELLPDKTAVVYQIRYVSSEEFERLFAEADE